MSSPGAAADSDAAAAVTALYQANALSMVRLAYVVLGDRGTAEDVVQDAFSGLYRRWSYVSDHGKALSYVRSSVLNACRSALRRARPELSGDTQGEPLPPNQRSVEAAALAEDERATVMAALRRLPGYPPLAEVDGPGGGSRVDGRDRRGRTGDLERRQRPSAP